MHNFLLATVMAFLLVFLGCKGARRMAVEDFSLSDEAALLAESDNDAGPDDNDAGPDDDPEIRTVSNAVEYSLESDFETDESTFVKAASANIPVKPSLIELPEGAELTERLDDASGPVLLDFYADWCGPCKTQGKILHDLVDQGEGPATQIIKINIDEHPQLAKKLQVKRLPTLMIVQDGSVVKRQTGAMGKEELVAWMQLD